MTLWLALATTTLAFAALVVLFTLAVILLRLRNERRSRALGALENAWEATLLDVLAARLPPDALLSLVRPDQGPFFVTVLMRYARRVRGPEYATLVRLAEPWMSRIADGADHADENVRARSIQALGVLGMPQWAGQVTHALRDASPLVAMVAARELARPEHAHLAITVVQELDRFDSWDRTFIAAMLAGVGAPLAPSLLQTMADASRSEGARIIAAETLRRLNHLEAADLAARLLPGASHELAAAYLRLIEQTGRASHVAPVRELLGSPHDFLRTRAVSAYAALAEREDVRLTLLPMLADPSPWVALQAARSLAPVAPYELAAIARLGKAGADAAREALSLALTA